MRSAVCRFRRTSQLCVECLRVIGETHRFEKRVESELVFGGVAVTLLKKLRVLEGKVAVVVQFEG